MITHKLARLPRLAYVFVLAAFLAAGMETVHAIRSVGSTPHTRSFLADRLVSSIPLPDSDGDMCQWIPAKASATLMMQAESEGTADAGVSTPAPPRPSEAVRAEIAKRKPLREIQDPYSGFAGIAVDPIRNEVVMADENLFSIRVYDRQENTPPKAKLSEPKRIIQGENTDLEFACSVYVDPANGDIYAINNDTMNWMPIFSHDAKGDIAPKRKLQTITSAYGIVADEAAQELFITIQNDHAVVVFKKSAEERDAALRSIQGPHTRLGDPHGITLDPKTDLLYVSNWGSTNVRTTPPEGNGKRNLPIPRNHAVPGSGSFGPPSITVYPKDAKGDASPVQVIQGPKTQLSWPTSLAVHPERGELFVANDSGDSVLVFRADAQGDVAPIRVLKGPKTLIKTPTGVAVDLKNNELWVANFGSHSATVFKIDADGDVPPVRVIRSGPLGAPAPMIGNPHTMAFDTKRDEILVAN